GLTIDMEAFEACMEQQRERARGADAFANDYSDRLAIDATSEFTGYDGVVLREAQILGLYQDGNAVDSLAVGDEGLVVLDQTPFYAESGGQIGDTGVLVANGAEFTVKDTRKRQDAIVHVGKVTQGSLNVGQCLSPQVDEYRRLSIMQHHSATHLMHAAL